MGAQLQHKHISTWANGTVKLGNSSTNCIKNILSYTLEHLWSVALCQDANETIPDLSSSFIIHLIYRQLPSQFMLIYLPIIISGREDATVKLWNRGTYCVRNTLSYS
jgi:hypothetical protein